jgi:YfiH family protein
VRHGFFGRQGGVSEGIYASLNAGTGSSDDPDKVMRNRARIAAAFDAPAEKLVGVHQVHSAVAVLTNAPFRVRPQADAMVTTTPGLVLSILTADCAPVLLADAEAGVIGAAHAGWKGALGGVLDGVVNAMRAAGAQHIAGAIGPCIHQPSYEVGPDFAATFCAADPAHERFFAPGRGDRRQFDLPGFCGARLAALGVETVETLAHDTYPAAEHFFPITGEIAPPSPWGNRAPSRRRNKTVALLQ